MASLPRVGRRLAVLVGGLTLAVPSLAADAAAKELKRTTFTLEAPEHWVESALWADDRTALLKRQGDASAECLIEARMDNLPLTEQTSAEWEQFLASEDGPNIIAEFQVGHQETVIKTTRRRTDVAELVVVVTEKEEDRIVTAHFFSISRPRIHIIRCVTGVASDATLEAEFAAIIDALKVKP